MKKIKLLKTLLISTIGITAIGTIAAVSTSCSSAVVIVTGVSLNKELLPLGIGKSDTLIANINPENATDKSVTWTSSNSSVATVDNNGKVTAVGKGRAIITVKTNDGGFTDTCQVTVYQEIIHVIGVSLNKESLTLEIDDSDTLIATVLPEDATDKSVTWSSSNSSVATVDNNGKVTAVGEGQATITVTTNDCGFTDTCQVTVKQKTIHVTDVSLNKGSLVLDEGDSDTLTATVLPADATDKSVTWSSSDSSVATIDNNGKVTAVKEGSAKITVKTNDGGFTATCQVTVYEQIIPVPYICVTANADSTLELINDGRNNPNLQYSVDGSYWTTYAGKLTIPADLTLYLKGNNANGWSLSGDKYSHFNITGNVSISGNVMGLLDNGTGTISSIPNDYCFFGLFSNSTGITSVSDNFLPATGLTEDCYAGMFQGCTSLTTALDLPAQILAKSCYECLFDGCSSLTTAPDLPAATLADYCYSSMFANCTSLTTAPELPATTLAESCYYAMFLNCSSLTVVPDLPATTLADSCYVAMYGNCTSLTAAPDLPATELAPYCYRFMFENCVNLASIRIGYKGTVDRAPKYAFTLWVYNVAQTGTFYYKGSDTLENFGFTSGWTINPN